MNYDLIMISNASILFLPFLLQPPFYSQNINIMYQQILNASLSFPPDVNISPEAKSLLEGVICQPTTIISHWCSSLTSRLCGVCVCVGVKLLTRDATKRLGTEDKNASDIKRHPFFKSIDWEKLYRRVSLLLLFSFSINKQQYLTHYNRAQYLKRLIYRCRR